MIAADVGAASAPRLQDLPAAWTVLQCLAWISLRDPAVVRDAGPTATPGPGDGPDRWCSLTLSAEWVYRKTEPAYQLGPRPGEAEAALLAKLQAGTLAAIGTPADGSGRRMMTPDDWAGLRFYGPRHSIQPAPARTMGQRWEDVTLARDELLREWRPFAASDEGRSSSPVIEEPLWAPPVPPLDALPADWTLMEAVAWIALRDPVVVQRAGTVHDEGSIAVAVPDGCAEGRVRPDGSMVPADWPATGGIPLHWIDCEHGQRSGGAEGETMAAGDAVKALVEALRRGTLTAEAEWVATGERREMKHGEWRSLTLDTRPGEAAVLVPHDEATDRSPWHDPRWRVVTVARDTVLQVWPTPGLAAPARSPRRAAGQQSGPLKQKRSQGQRVSNAVARAFQVLGAKLAAEGAPAPRDGGQAILERWFAEKVEAFGGSISVGRARVHVRRAIEAHKQALDKD